MYIYYIHILYTYPILYSLSLYIYIYTHTHIHTYTSIYHEEIHIPSTTRGGEKNRGRHRVLAQLHQAMEPWIHGFLMVLRGIIMVLWWFYDVYGGLMLFMMVLCGLFNGFMIVSCLWDGATTHPNVCCDMGSEPTWWVPDLQLLVGFQQ